LYWGGREVPLGPGKQQCVLVVLLMAPGHSVPVETLVDRAWDEGPPRASNAVAPYAARLRRILEQAVVADVPGDGPGVLRFTAGGYRIDCDPHSVDLHQARYLASAAHAAEQAGEDERAVDLLTRALADWQALALAGVPGQWAQRVRGSLANERLELIARRAETRLRLGRHAEVVEELRGLVAEHPHAEGLLAPLLVALAGTGRAAEALHYYAQARESIAEEFGAEPSPRLQELHLRILRQDPVPASAAPPPATTGSVPAQLPADIGGFAGRVEHLARLDDLLAAADAEDRSTSVVVSVVAGTAGVGKTALAVRWAHRVADRFPDGQLYVNLRGFDASGQVMTPAAAVRGFLEALGVPPERVPVDLDAQVALYRGLLVGRRMLVVLDNARDADHVRSLLPTTPTVLTVVTSRNQLTSLVVTEGAHPVAVEPLPNAEATELLTRRLGADRVAAEPEAVQAIITACAGLPLALSIVSARALQTGFPLASLAEELDGTRRLDALDAGDPTTQVRAVLSWSYATLTPPATRLFRLLGLHPGPECSAAAAASLAGQPVSETRRLLTELTRANLLTEPAPHRYSFHDLLRAYATDLVHTEDTDDDRNTALTRLLDHYLHTAQAADRLLDPNRASCPIPFDPPAEGSTPERLADYTHALAWFSTEYRVLLAAVHCAAAAQRGIQAWQLSWCLQVFGNRRGLWLDQIATFEMMLRSAADVVSPAARATTHHYLGRAHATLRRHTDTHRHLQYALDLYVLAGDRTGQAQILRSLGAFWGLSDQPDKALQHSREALDLYRLVDHHLGQAMTLNNIALHLVALGEYAQAVTCCEEALAILQDLDDPEVQAHAWDTLGYAHHSSGQYATATNCFQRALALAQSLGDRYHEAGVMDHLGDTHLVVGDVDAARIAWTEAVRVFDDLGHPDAGKVRTKLNDLGEATAVPGDTRTESAQPG
jgi:DNA-binding SARP family transcriptional activator